MFLKIDYGKFSKNFTPREMSEKNQITTLFVLAIKHFIYLVNVTNCGFIGKLKCIPIMIVLNDVSNGDRRSGF